MAPRQVLKDFTFVLTRMIFLYKRNMCYEVLKNFVKKFHIDRLEDNYVVKMHQLTGVAEASFMDSEFKSSYSILRSYVLKSSEEHV